MGAAQFLFPDGNEDLIKQCSAYGKEGLTCSGVGAQP